MYLKQERCISIWHSCWKSDFLLTTTQIGAHREINFENQTMQTCRAGKLELKSDSPTCRIHGRIYNVGHGFDHVVCQARSNHQCRNKNKLITINNTIVYNLNARYKSLICWRSFYFSRITLFQEDQAQRWPRERQFLRWYQRYLPHPLRSRTLPDNLYLHTCPFFSW